MLDHIIPRSSRKLWIESFVWGIGITLVCIGYNFIRVGSINPYLINTSIAFSALFLILLSHALSGTSYFWGLGKSKLGYRKSLGVVGFAFAITHFIIATLLYSNNLKSFDFFLLNLTPFIASGTAITLFTYMVVISNFGIPAKLGALKWRMMLRWSGYLGIILIMTHVAILSISEWRYWFTNFKPILPPLNLILIILSITTLLLRIALWISLKNKPAAPPTTAQTQPNPAITQE